MTQTLNARALEAEHRIVTTCIRWPKHIDEVEVEAEHFAGPRMAAAWEAVRALHREGRAIDELVVQEAVGGKVGLDELAHIDGLPSMLPEYAAIVREEHAKRLLVTSLSEVVQSRKEGATADEMLSAASQAIAAATIGQPDQAVSVRSIVEGRILELGEMSDRIAKGDPAATGIPTGLERLDKVLGGIQPGIVTLMAARPSMGKSTVALTLTANVVAAGIGVHVFSLEDTRDAYADRVLSHYASIPTDRIRACQFQAGDLAQLGVASKRIARGGWLVDDRSGITAEELVRCVRRKAEENRTRLVIVDYISLLRGRKGQDIRSRIDEAVHTLGDAAKQDRMAYLVLAQLNRECEKRDDKRPTLSDLKESGTLEERSKAVLMLYRHAKYHDCDCNPDRKQPCQHDREMEILVRKNSNGITGKVTVEWRPEEMRVK